MINRFFILLIIAYLITGCQSSKAPILIDGSTTMFELNKVWAEAYMKKNPGVEIMVAESGTKKGIEALLDGKCDIADTSRKLSTEEILKAKEKGVDLGEFYAGFGLYCIAVNPENPVNQLDEEQVKNIFSGKITNWKEVGGNDKEIKVLYREISPNEYDYFLEKFVNVMDSVDMAKLPSNINVLKNPEAIVEEIAKDKDTIGYFLINYQSNKTKSLALSKKDKNKFVQPSVEGGETGDYPVLRPYYMYINKYAKQHIRDYISFIYSKEGIDLAKKMNFVPVPIKNGDIDRTVLFEYI